MKYQKLTPSEQIVGLENRVRQLEEEHYTNTVFIFECEIIGDKVTLSQLEDSNKSVEKRIIALNKKIDELRETLPKESLEDDDSV